MIIEHPKCQHQTQINNSHMFRQTYMIYKNNDYDYFTQY